MSEDAENGAIDEVDHDEGINGEDDSINESPEKSEFLVKEEAPEETLESESTNASYVQDAILNAESKVSPRKVMKPCPFCGGTFSLSDLSRHIKQVHKKIEEACPVCGKFISKANLSKHVRYVHKLTLQELREADNDLETLLNKRASLPKEEAKRKHEADEEPPSTNGSDRRTSGRKRKRNQRYEEGTVNLEDFEDDTNEDYSIPITPYSTQSVPTSSLRSISRPKLSNQNEYSVTPGYRIVDMTLMRTALKASQRCGHNSVTLAETSHDSDSQEDLATILAFVCSECGTQTVFANSAFSDESPSNYLLNKTMLPLLGEEGYCALSQVVQSKDGASKLEVEFNNDTLDTELVMSTANGDQAGMVCEPELDDLLIKEEPGDSEGEINEKEEISEKSKSTDSDSGSMKVFPVPGGMLTPIPPGTKISSSNVTRTTTSEVLVIFGEKFPPGVYRFSSLVDGSQSIFIIRDDGGDKGKKGGSHQQYQPLNNQPYPAWKKKGHQLGGKKCAKPSVSNAISKASKTRKTPLEFFSKEVKDGMLKNDPDLSEDDVTKLIIDRWIKMSNDEKEVYRKMVLNPDLFSEKN